MRGLPEADHHCLVPFVLVNIYMAASRVERLLLTPGGVMFSKYHDAVQTLNTTQKWLSFYFYFWRFYILATSKFSVIMHEH